MNHLVSAALTYFETKCMAQTSRRFRCEFMHGRIPSLDAFSKWIDGFVVCGTSAVNEFSGYARSVRTPENSE